MEATRRNLIDILTAWEFFCNLNRNVTGKYTFITQLTKVIVTDREDAFTVRILRSAQEVTWTTSEGHIENVEFLLFEEFKLQEIREVFTEWTDFSSKTKLAVIIRPPRPESHDARLRIDSKYVEAGVSCS